ncbi:MAG: iron ABC transporter permease [Lachnospiraceae bacterium]|nr:iron ABC transporter permease [Lachnospiraceae bacterium]
MNDSGIRKRRIIIAGFLILLVLIVILAILNLISGSSSVSVKEVINLISGSTSDNLSADIVLKLRLPRILSALLLGGILSVSGYLLQTYFSNPIAGPFVLGISSGAKLTVALALILLLERGIHISSWGMIGSAFAGSVLTMFMILLTASKTRRSSILIICGVMIGYLCSAITEIIINFADDSNIVNLHNWSMGSFSGISMDNVRIIFISTVILIASVISISKPVSALILGEEYAKGLGVNVRALKIAIILSACLMAAIVAAFAGPISFVGIAVPQLMRQLFRTEKAGTMIPACFLGGSVFCLFSDLIARTVFAPNELSISSITSILGAPVVIMMLIGRQNRRKLL